MAVNSAVALRDGSEVELRPLEAEDRSRLARLFYRLSPESVYRRFLSPLPDPSDAGLDRLVDVDHRHREALAAIAGDEVVGVARYFRTGETRTADLAVLVEDAWQRRGLAVILIEQLRELARNRGIETFSATILSENRPAVRLVRRVFPAAVFSRDGPELTALMPFDGPATMTAMGNSRRPLIGITCGSIGEGARVKYGQSRSYVRAIEDAGGVPLLIPPQSSIDELFAVLDGILFTGGGDLEPTLYDSEDRGSDGIDGERDELELALARRAVDSALPIFGICRGQQVINVALDGGLLQDVGEHRQDAPRQAATHEVDVAPGSHLAETIGERVEVNTFHHQVVDPDRIGRGLKVSAMSADGQRFIEGLESADGKILTVQWHPEDMTDREWARRLFRRLVESAATRTHAASG